MLTQEDDIPHLRRLVEGIPFAMLVTRDIHGTLHSRPMTVQEDEFNGDFWFFSSLSRGAAPDILHDPHVNLAFSDPKSSAYISVSGQAELSRDRAKMEKVWNPLYKTWFKNGLNDHDLTLIRVRVEKADYWESPGSKVVQFVAFTKGLVTGKGTAQGMAQHGHLNIHRE